MLYKRDAGYANHRAAHFHPSARELYMQTMYPSTIDTLRDAPRLRVAPPESLTAITFPQGRMNNPPGGIGARTAKKEMPGCEVRRDRRCVLPIQSQDLIGSTLNHSAASSVP